MNERAVAQYIRNRGKGERRITKAIKTIKKFESYLTKINKTVDQATPEELERFLLEYTRKYVAKYDLKDLKIYYAATNNLPMQNAVDELKYKFTPSIKLNEFLDIDPKHIDKLDKIGIKTNNQLLDVCCTADAREELASKVNIPVDVIEKLTKLSDLARIFAVRGIRCKLYYDSGVDSIEKMSQWEPTELRNMLVEFVEKTNFPGIATLPKEAKFTVEFAKKLPIVVEF